MVMTMILFRVRFWLYPPYLGQYKNNLCWRNAVDYTYINGWNVQNPDGTYITNLKEYAILIPQRAILCLEYIANQQFHPLKNEGIRYLIFP